MRRLKKESCSLSLGDDSLFAEQPLVKGHSKKLSSEEMKKEKAEEDWIQLCKFVEEMNFESNEFESSDFEGNFEKDPNSELRKRIRRIKVSETEPIILGRILSKSGNKRVPFVADTGCSVNIYLHALQQHLV